MAATGKIKRLVDAPLRLVGWTAKKTGVAIGESALSSICVDESLVI